MDQEKHPSLDDLTREIVAFRDARDWKQFHNPKDMALSFVLEAAEVMEHFQWKNEEEMKEHIQSSKKEIGDELADALYWILLMSHDFSIDIVHAMQEKMKKNAEKYPIEKSRGSHKKYNELTV